MLNNEKFYIQFLVLKNNYPDYPIKFVVNSELFVNSSGYQLEWIDYDYRGYNANCYQVSIEGFLTYRYANVKGKQIMKSQCETDKRHYVSYFSHLLKSDERDEHLHASDERIDELFEVLPWEYNIVVWIGE